jgi:hypothetical protein
MLLRASGQQDEQDYDLAAVTADHGDSGVPHSDLLRTLTEQAIRGQYKQLAETRERAGTIIGAQKMVDALAVAAAFNGITRVADATGIPLDDNTRAVTVELRANTGIDGYDYAHKSARFS